MKRTKKHKDTSPDGTVFALANVVAFMVGVGVEWDGGLFLSAVGVAYFVIATEIEI